MSEGVKIQVCTLGEIILNLICLKHLLTRLIMYLMKKKKQR